MTPPSPHSQNTSSVKLDFTLILASASPRRAELLQQAGYEFFVMVSPVSEPTRRPSSVPVRLWPACVAGIKAQAVAKRFIEPTIVLAADTIVVLGKQIINKAADRKQAREILWRLSEREHQVVTGIALMLGDHCRFASEVSVCKMRKVSEAWLKDYLNSDLWKGKAGAYGIQDCTADATGEKLHDPMVELVSGEWSNVVGLPMKLLTREIDRLQSDFQNDTQNKRNTP